MRMTLKHIGPIKEADIEFGDLTIFIGPQATGKSLALQCFKLVKDFWRIKHTLIKRGADWSDDVQGFLRLYFGDSASSLWLSSRSQIELDGRRFDLADSIKLTEGERALRQKRDPNEFDEGSFSTAREVEYVPSARATIMRNGWPQSFTDFSTADPFVLRKFSDGFRGVMLYYDEYTAYGTWPFRNIETNKTAQRLIHGDVYRGQRVDIATHDFQKRLVLKADGQSIPFQLWSTGQQECFPVLLAVDRAINSEPFRWLEDLVIEEPEAGLHPQAVNSVFFLLLQVVSAGVPVHLSTHSPLILELVWAIQTLKEVGGTPEHLLALFDAEPTSELIEMANTLMEKTIKVHYFGADGFSKDISTLDLDSDDSIVAEWGRLAHFSNRVNAVVSDAVSARSGD